MSRCNINLMANNAEFKMNYTNCQLKTRSEARFSMKSSRTSPLYSSKLGVVMLNCLLVGMNVIDK